jgi:leucyl-tRNA synthetase
LTRSSRVYGTGTKACDRVVVEEQRTSHRDSEPVRYQPLPLVAFESLEFVEELLELLLAEAAGFATEKF